MSGLCRNCGCSLTRDEPVTFGDVTIAPDHVTVGGRSIALTGTHRALLYALAKAHPRSVERDALIARITARDVEDNHLSVTVCNLRARLAAASVEGIAIVNVWGVGYRLEVAA